MATPALLDDYLFIGPLLQARLREQIAVFAPAGAVGGVKEMAEAATRAIHAPQAYVLWDGDGFATGDSGRAGTRSLAISQKWTVFVAVRHADQHQPDAVNEAAGPLLSAVHRAIHGWTPEGAFRPFSRVGGRRPVYRTNDGTYPVSFEISLNF